MLITLFAIGHCLPILAAGMSVAFVERLLGNHGWQRSGDWFRRGAGVVIILLAAYFIANPLRQIF